ncbi:ornithine-acyl-ACP acyltransferase [Sinisalibacter aestuarii]|uniref:L-ornithine N(alpha)-acyltransferase n=2 Tax=Sinisalibacter aestuarii TaxID=2949426 RepID=A0ABQ5LRJ5_9RHOB|nr:ornithine-acyl-ACP acyltransferase [Sinisalibacter aestuarii]
METARYRARLAATEADLARSLALRARAFRGDSAAEDADSYDARCRHMLVEDKASGALVCTYRLLSVASGREIGESYSAQFYELGALAGFDGRMVEVGRFCIAPGVKDADVLRVAWGALARIVDAERVGMLFGCSSFHGTEPGAYADAFALLRARHMAPVRWRPRVKAPDVFRFAARLRHRPDARRALKAMPPLLRTYLMMGGWVSDHAVVDRDLGTLHVFTGLEVGRVPEARARALRGLVSA